MTTFAGVKVQKTDLGSYFQWFVFIKTIIDDSATCSSPHSKTLCEQNIITQVVKKSTDKSKSHDRF